ncbi:phage protein Gp37 [Achromobacter xylosoxidans]
MAHAVIISRIQAAMVERLTLGLGRLVKSVTTYGGELDDDLGAVVRRLPAVWVAFLGIQDTRPMNTARTKYLARGRFTVMAGQRSVRSEAAARTGSREETGTDQLVTAIRRLLTGQDFGLDDVGQMVPGAVRPLFNARAKGDATSIFAAEFDVKWVERALENGRWPSPDPDQAGNPDAANPDLLLAEAGGKTDAPYPWLTAIELDYRLAGCDSAARSDPTVPDPAPPDATDTVEFNED